MLLALSKVQVSVVSLKNACKNSWKKFVSANAKMSSSLSTKFTRLSVLVLLETGIWMQAISSNQPYLVANFNWLVLLPSMNIASSKKMLPLNVVCNLSKLMNQLWKRLLLFLKVFKRNTKITTTFIIQMLLSKLLLLFLTATSKIVSCRTRLLTS